MTNLDTDQLIDSLAAQYRPVDTAWIERVSGLLILAGFLVSASLIWLTIGFRTDLVIALETGRILTKYVFMLASVGLAGRIFVHMARPGYRIQSQAWIYGVPLGFILVAILIQFQFAGEPTRAMVLGETGNWLACMAIVPVLSVVPMAGLLAILRRSAPTDLTGAGFAAGMFAATIAALAYAAHCPCDTPVFVGLWYPIAFLISAGIGAALAPRLARW